MRALVVYFSLDGNTKFISDTIAEAIKADAISLATSKVYPTEGVKKYLWGGKSVLFNEMPPLTNPSINLSGYDTLIIGTPVWAGNYAPPIKTFLNQYKIKGKRIALFACHGGGGAENCFKKFKLALPGNTFIGETDFKEPYSDPDNSGLKAKNWALGLIDTPV